MISTIVGKAHDRLDAQKCGLERSQLRQQQETKLNRKLEGARYNLICDSRARKCNKIITYLGFPVVQFQSRTL